MTDEALFYRRFLDDVRRCAAGHAPACVAEIERRIRIALAAPQADRESGWARVVAAVNELLAGHAAADPSAARRLRAFVRENADLDQPRDVAITDFHFEARVDGVLTFGNGRRYLAYARFPRAVAAQSLDEIVAAPARRLAEWSVYGLCGGAALAALWFAFIVPV